jgi:Xaa-Pro aminopeptidase
LKVQGPDYAPALEPSMKITWGNIGMYSNKGWGIRYEDTFAITKNGPVILSAE